MNEVALPAAPAGLYPGSLLDVAGLAVGHATRRERPTGCTVVRCESGWVCGVDQRGGAPGTRETDLLKSENTVERVHALLLTGGSAFGLDAAAGVMRWLEARGHGVSVGPIVVPIVPAAVLFDLWVGDHRVRPGADEGYAACEAARTDVLLQGSVGAGAGCSVGKLFGVERAMRGGIGSASLRVGSVTVAALVAVNAVGDVIGDDGRVVAGARSADGRPHGASAALWRGEGPARLLRNAPPAGSATTIGIVATDAALTKTQANMLARLAHHGLSRAVDPVTVNDGDTLFALANPAGTPGADPSLLGAMAAECVARAIRNGVRAAEALTVPDLPAAR